ncbi:MAG: hypothetical protein ACK4UJ_12425 [Leptonema sp. (in: bacteria)]
MKCGDCVYFRRVKIIYAKDGSVENAFGFCEKTRGEDLISADEPACKDFLEDKYPEYYQ